MKLSPPKQITFWIAVVVAFLGVIASLVTLPVLSGFAFWLVAIGFGILAVGNLVDGISSLSRELINDNWLAPQSWQSAPSKFFDD